MIVDDDAPNSCLMGITKYPQTPLLGLIIFRTISFLGDMAAFSPVDLLVVLLAVLFTMVATCHWSVEWAGTKSKIFNKKTENAFCNNFRRQ